MSIMSDTYIIKSNGAYILYTAGGFTFPDDFIAKAKEKHLSVFDFFGALFDPKYSSYWGRPTSVSEKEVIEIADADHSVNDGKPGYSRFAGDEVYLIDKDEKRVYYRTRTPRDSKTRLESESYLLAGTWKEMK
jgi:hypothetical protein